MALQQVLTSPLLLATVAGKLLNALHHMPLMAHVFLYSLGKKY